ncbi:MAG: isopeptide-forming domain-containing fimbrial protein [Rhodanobacteraceae bacterium]|nr:isopeptide-forming domain-containing fimbrial protein [Rhodanobacteraceae bacterium]
MSTTLNAGVVSTRQFIYVYAQAGEVILLGSRNRNNSGNIFVYNPQLFGAKGNETIPGVASFTCSSQSGRGYIASRNEELAGPNSADGSATVANGFNPCWYVAPSTGIYGVRFTAANTGSTNSASISNPEVLNGNRVSAWDVTVRSNVSSLGDLNGRVFTYAWSVYLNSNARYLRNALYVVSSDGFRYKQTFRNLDPNRATFYANSQGFVDDGRPLYRDVRGSNQTVGSGPSFTAGVSAQAPEYPIFFSNVDPGGPNAAEINRVLTALALPLAPAQPLLQNPDFVGNISGNQSTVSAGGVFTFDTQNTLTYEIVISLDGVDFDPANVSNRVLTGTALTGSHSVLWDGMNNNGIPFPAGNYDFRIYGRNGEIHFPMLDVEGNSWGGPTLEKLNGFQPADRFTVYYDDRGYRTANGTLVGALNGHLCGAASPIAQPAPAFSLVGVDSSAGGPNNYYRRWTGSSDSNTDCNNNANEFFATAKGLDLWALERSPVLELPIEIIDPAVGVDVGTQVSVTSEVLPGGTAYGSFSFNNAGDGAANGVTYSVAIGNPLDPSTCPASVNFTLLPPGVSATYNGPPSCDVTFTGMPTTLAPGDSLVFNFNYVVALSNAGPIPVDTGIQAANENNDVASNTASAETAVAQPVVNVGKSASPSAGSAVNVGDVITYTLQVNISNAPLTATLTLDDVLGAGLAFGSVIGSHPNFSCSGSLSCELPAATAVGTYTVTYTASVDANAGNSVQNNVTATGGGGNPPGCGACSLQHPVNRPNLDIQKSGPATAQVGVPYDYVISVNNTGTADATTDAQVTDTIPVGLTIGVLPAACVLNPPASQTVVCTIPAVDLELSDPPVSFTIPVTPAASLAGDTISNTASVTGAGDPDCVTVGDCESGPPVETSVPAPTVTIAKSADPVSGTSVTAGQLLTYTVTVTVANSATLSDVVVSDTLGAGLTFGTVTVPGSFTANTAGNPLLFTLPAGAVPGTYAVEYTATVDTDATVSVGNAITATGGGDPGDPGAPDPTCSTPGGCTTNHPLTDPTVTIAKSADPVSGTSVTAGQLLTYTVTVTVANSATLSDVVVSDTLGAGLTFGTVTVPGSFTANTAGNPLLFTLPAGAVPGTYAVEYTATVDTDATVSVGNAITATGGGDPGDPGAPDPTCSTPGGCTTNHPLTDPTVTIAKSADPVSGTSVTAGQLLTYTVTVTVANSATLSDVVVSDTLGAGLTFGTVTVPGSFTANTAGNPLLFTLPAGAVPGTYAVEYTATVDTDATVSVGNAITATGGGDPGDPGAPDPTCSTPGGCTTNHPLTDPTVTIAKSADPVSGTSVTAGQLLTYTVTVTVANSATLSDVVVSDTLGAGLTFGTVTVPGSFTANTAGNPLLFTLPAGAVPGTYAVEYTATVDTDATVSVGNAITATGGGDPGDPGAPDPTCSTPGGCTTNHPLTDPTVTIAKSADPVSGTSVTAGQLLTYTVTVTVANSATLSDVVVSDTLGAGLTFGTVTVPGSFTANTAGNPLLFTLPAGAVPGTYAVEYTATVDTDATVSVGNAITATGGGDPGDPGAPDPTCSTPGGCTTNHPLTDPTVTIAKSADPVSGTSVTAGQLLTYTVTVTVANSATLSDVVVSDTLGAGLTFGTVTVPGSFTANTAGNPLLFTLPAGAVPGTYAVEYTATVDTDATVSVGNAITATGGGDPGDPGAPDPTCSTPGGCTTNHPLTDPTVTIAKSADPVSGTSVTAGQLLTYTVTVTVANSATLSDVVVSDTLGAGLTFGTVTVPGSFTANTAGNPLLFTLPAGAVPGTYAVEYTATVDTDATVSVGNAITATGGGDPGDPGAPDPTCSTPGGCTTNHPLTDPTVTIAKSADPVSGTSVTAGQLLTYTVTVTVANSATLSDVVVSDTLGAGLTFGTVTVPGSFTANTAGNPLLFTLPAGAVPGTYAVEYTATVDTDATVSVGNAITATGGGDPGDPGAPDPTCSTPGGCTTNHPLGDPALSVQKSVDAYQTIGPGSYRVTWLIEVTSAELHDTYYTLTDTTDFPISGVDFNGVAMVTTTGGIVNPVLAGGSYVPVNGGGQQISDAGVLIASGATHSYRISMSLRVSADELVDAACNGSPGHGLFNTASLAGTGLPSSDACQSVTPGQAAIRLHKVVELGVDLNGNHFGDVGDVLSYGFLIENIGSQDLQTLYLLDPQVTDLVCDDMTLGGQSIRVWINGEIFASSFGSGALSLLAVGDSVMCFATHTLTPSDVNRGRVVNTATTTASGESDEVVSSTSTAIYGAFQ